MNGDSFFSPQLRERLALLKIAEKEAEEEKRDNILKSKVVSTKKRAKQVIKPLSDEARKCSEYPSCLRNSWYTRIVLDEKKYNRNRVKLQ